MSSPTSPSTPYDFSHLIQPPNVVIHHTVIIYPTCKHPCQGLQKCLHCLHKENLEWCPRCKQTTIRTLGLDLQQCYKCEFRPGSDCPECSGQNTVSGNQFFQSCELCNWHNESFLHIPMADDLTFTEAEQQPEVTEETYETKKVSKKQARDDAAARRSLMSKEELREDTQETKFCGFVAHMLTRLKCKDSERGSLIESSKIYLQAYRKFAQKQAEQGEKKFEPARTTLQEKLQELKARYKKIGYTEAEFKRDTQWFDSREPNCIKTRWDQQMEQLKPYFLHLEQKKKYNEWVEKAFESSQGTNESEPPLTDMPQITIENERFLRWRDYQHESDSLTRELKRNRAEVGRISDRIASLENLAVVSLFLLNETKGFFQFRDLPVFYASATGVLKPPPPTVQEYYDSLKSELGLKELSFKDQLTAQVEGVKQLITRQRQLQFSSGDQARIDKLIAKVELTETHLALMHLAAGVILNALCEVNIPNSNSNNNKNSKKWSTKFIAEATGFANSKIAEASKALKYKISLLGDLVENNKSKKK